MATWVARRRGVALRRARPSSQALLPKEHPIKKFDKCDFGPLREWVARDRELKKAKTDDEKKEAKVEKDKTLLQNGYAIMDGRLEKVRRVLPLSLVFGSSCRLSLGTSLFWVVVSSSLFVAGVGSSLVFGGRAHPPLSHVDQRRSSFGAARRRAVSRAGRPALRRRSEH